MKSIIISMFLFFALIGFFGCKDNSSSPSNASVNGDWTGTTQLIGGAGSYSLELNLIQVGQNVTGTGKFTFVVAGQPHETPIPAVTGTFNNPDLNLTVPGTSDFGGYQGKLQSDGKTIIGNFMYQNAPISMNLSKK